MVRGVEGGAAGGSVYGYARMGLGLDLVGVGGGRVDDVADVVVVGGARIDVEAEARNGAGAVGAICVNCKPAGVRRRCCAC